MDFLRFYFPFFCIHWLMDYILGIIVSRTALIYQIPEVILTRGDLMQGMVFKIMYV